MKVKKDTFIILASGRVTATLSPDIRHTPWGLSWSWTWWRTRPVVTSSSFNDMFASSTTTIRPSDTRHMSFIKHLSLSWSVLTTMSFPWETFALEKSMTLSTMKFMISSVHVINDTDSNLKIIYMIVIFFKQQLKTVTITRTHIAQLSATISLALCTDVENAFSEIRQQLYFIVNCISGS